MTLRYQNISLGYLGKQYSAATINSQYYAELFHQLDISDDFITAIHVFPQRIPRSGFFEELISLETEKFRVNFDAMLGHITLNYKNALEIMRSNPSEENARRYINWSNIMLRYCQFQTIMDCHPSLYFGPYCLEIKLINEIAFSEISLSNGNPITLHGALDLADDYLTNKLTTDREKILLLNHIIVTHYRYQIKNSNQDKIYQLSKIYSECLQKLDANTFISKLLLSIGYRGLAMVSELGKTMQSSLLEQSEALARTLQGTNEFEKIVAKDNLMTCLQTMSKWSLLQDKTLEATNYLNEIISIDNYDSTGHSELGLFYFANNEFQDAAEHFKNALELGPPGAGMNAYYYALCLFELGCENDAITHLHLSINLDKQAISPWLDLIQYYLQNNIAEKAINTAKQIFASPILLDQLDEDEIKFIQNIIK